MERFGRRVILLVFVIPAIARLAPAGDIVRIKFNPTVNEYCHILRFPLGWQMPKFVPKGDGTLEIYGTFNLEAGDYEFRVPGILGTRFLVRGFDAYGYNKYTTNIYEVDLSDPKAVAQSASEEAWNAATPVPLRYVGPAEVLAKFIRSTGFRYGATGVHDREAVRVSPDRAILVAQSWSGTLGPGGGSDVPGDFSISLKFGWDHGKLFWDVYSTDTGKKLLTIAASFFPLFPGQIFDRTGWVTERYFFIPLDQRRERCLICDFGRKR